MPVECTLCIASICDYIEIRSLVRARDDIIGSIVLSFSGCTLLKDRRTYAKLASLGKMRAGLQGKREAELLLGKTQNLVLLVKRALR